MSLKNCRSHAVTASDNADFNVITDETINPDYLKNLPNLRFLDLGRSSIKIIRENAFVYLKNLQVLKLHFSNIQVLHENAFRGLKHLRILNLEYNPITAFPKHLLDPLEELET
ncbi:Toll-like receptor 13, partial [Trichoplax sp. H2]